jgi:hypothetical protein
MNVSAFNHLFYLPLPIEKRRLPASLYHPTYKLISPTTYSERSRMRWDRRKDIELLVGPRDEWVGIASIKPSLRILVEWYQLLTLPLDLLTVHATCSTILFTCYCLYPRTREGGNVRPNPFILPGGILKLGEASIHPLLSAHVTWSDFHLPLHPSRSTESPGSQ